MRIIIESIKSVAEQDLVEKPIDISTARWERIRVIKPVEDKKRSLLAGRLLQRMYQELGIEDALYETQENGKPYLSNYPDVTFSISHSGEYVVLVYDTQGKAIGIDIQNIRNLSDGLKRRILHIREFVPEGLSKEQQNHYLNRVWAIKESYVKMTGKGLTQDFRKLLIDMEKGSVTDENGNGAYFTELDAPQGYVMVVSIIQDRQ